MEATINAIEQEALPVSHPQTLKSLNEELRKALMEIRSLHDQNIALKQQLGQKEISEKQLKEQLQVKEGVLKKETKKRFARTKAHMDTLAQLGEKETQLSEKSKQWLQKTEAFEAKEKVLMDLLQQKEEELIQLRGQSKKLKERHITELVCQESSWKEKMDTEKNNLTRSWLKKENQWRKHVSHTDDDIRFLMSEVEQLQMASATATYGQKETSDQNFDYMFKILIIGNSSVGKTSFLFRYADDSFTPAFVSTVGIDFKVKTIYRNDKRIKLQIWDTAGQERYRTITTAYYRGAMGFILMYDITNEESFNAVQDWSTQIKTYSWDNAQVLLVGNKCDMEDERVVSGDRGHQLSDHLGEFSQSVFVSSSSLQNEFRPVQGLSSLKPVPKTTSTSSRLLSVWWTSSVKKCLRAWTQEILLSLEPNKALN
ncbi:RAB3A, member RAS oncogene family, b isoform X1 [Synchiropus splendidus]|uniref:RAB3A, member RAS oncogene family, b isoform X1 n=1 Tax=Synchiropus splendidus TaxID=270530 RepID=UPI00237E0307|nr:RAB3A, member RAS oncogene family, b isoform X1 [Synchiropus splendidus]